MSVRSNHNMHCPQCGSDSDLTVEAMVYVKARLYSDGTDNEGGDTEWDDKSGVRCGVCGWSGTVGQASKALEKAKTKAGNELGRDVVVDEDTDEIGEALDQHSKTPLNDLITSLKAKRRQLNDAGGRGVELADEIDSLTVAISVMKLLPKCNRKAKK